MTPPKPPSFSEFMEGLTGHLKAQADGGYLDGLVAPVNVQEPPDLNMGERIRRLREERNLSRAQLAELSGLDEAMVRRVEEDLVSPPLGTLIKLSKALKLKMGAMLSPGGPKPYTVVRARQGQVVSRYASKAGQRLGYAYRHLAFEKGDRSMEPFLITLEPGQVDETQSSHDGEEFIFVLDGQMEARFGEKVEILDPGDAIYYHSNQAHLVKARGEREALILAVIYAPA